VPAGDTDVAKSRPLAETLDETHMSLKQTWVERGTYIAAGGEQIYTISINCESPVAAVLLCGPFPTERLNSLGAWMKWARFLAANKVMAVRFDYRGTGESTGRFVEMDFDIWGEDIIRMADWMAENLETVPLILHGLGMGALLAQKAFALDKGNGLLMWSPPLEARDILKQGLMTRLAMDMALQKPGRRKSAHDYFNDLSSGQTIEVDGLTWSPALWRSSENMELDNQYALAGQGADGPSQRPWSHIVLGSDMAPLVRSSTLLRAMNPRAAVVPSFPLNPDLSGFFRTNLDWIMKKSAGNT
jgi:alpha-beta hydrolase superfamily lysophospholipase